jgi:hypothetical protein
MGRITGVVVQYFDRNPHLLSGVGEIISPRFFIFRLFHSQGAFFATGVLVL